MHDAACQPRRERPHAIADAATAPIVRLLEPALPREARVAGDSASDDVARARAFAAPLVIGRELPTGEGVLAHADGVAAVLAAIGAAPALLRRGVSRPRRRRSSASPTRC